MGAWSHDSFGNDDASDWAYRLEDCTDLSLIDASRVRFARPHKAACP